MRSVDLNLKLEIVDKPVVLLTAPGYTHTPSRRSGNTRPKTILTQTDTGGPTNPNSTDLKLTITISASDSFSRFLVLYKYVCMYMYV